MLASRGLPGIRIDVAPPPPAETLPRMDIAVFVGFAAMGPTHRPVAIESVAQFAAVFGSDAVLAWDAERGEPARAHLGPAVRAFFANGGRRCWVIRVARTAEHDALWRDRTPPAAAEQLAQANLFAVPGVLLASASGGLEPALVQARSAGAWSDGLRVSTQLGAHGFELDDIAFHPASPAGRGVRFTARMALRPGDLVEIADDGARTFVAVDSTRTTANGHYEIDATHIRSFAALGEAGPSPLVSELGEAEIVGVTNGTVGATLESGTSSAGNARLLLTHPTSPASAEGRWARWTGGGSTVWLRIDAVSETPAPTGPATLEVAGPAWRETSPALASSGALRASLLTLDICASAGRQMRLRRDGVGLTPVHGSSWWRETSDDIHYATPDNQGDPNAAAARTFPFAARDEEHGPENAPAAWIPLGAPLAFGGGLGVLPQIGTPLERDGLAHFDAELFLDPGLDMLGINTLQSEADAIRYLRDEPRRLFGLHGAFSIGANGRCNEASLIAIPDALHIGWTQQPAAPAPVIPEPAPAPEAPAGDFAACAGDAPEAPQPQVPERLVVIPDEVWTVLPRARFAPQGEDELLRVHRALLRMAAASGELFAVLGLPRHYRTADAAAHTARLRAERDSRVPDAFDFNERVCLSYGAVYHPWIVSGASGQHVVPPDGFATGILAARAARRGAWIAPANEPLKDAVALTPEIGPEDWLALQEARVNLFRAEPRGFLALNADTLADDIERRPINVRRLLILLRRMALRRGASYVFEPNGAALRRAVERGFTTLLDDLFRRGAFAGATQAESFKIVTDETVNTAAERDAGRFLAQLRVAPSWPLQFLNVSLAQSGERLTVAEEL